MRTMRLFAALCVAILVGTTTAQAQNRPDPTVWAERAAWLQAHGRTVSRPHIVLIAPADSVTDAWQQALADSLDRGVAAIRRLIGGPYPWQAIGDRRVTFYLSPERGFPTHPTRAGIESVPDAVFATLERARRGTALFFREGSIELLLPAPAARRADTTGARFPNWLFWYGIGGYLAHTVADAEGLHEESISDGGMRADSVCAARVAAAPPSVAAVLGLIGATGDVASFFVPGSGGGGAAGQILSPCTLSMTKFLVDKMGGVKPVVALFPGIRAGTWERDIEAAGGRGPAARVCVGAGLPSSG